MEPNAAIEGPTLIVQLPLWQIGVVITSAGVVVFSVWLATRDLKNEVINLKASIQTLSGSLIGFGQTVDRLRNIITKLRERIAHLEAVNGIRHVHTVGEDLDA